MGLKKSLSKLLAQEIQPEVNTTGHLSLLQADLFLGCLELADKEIQELMAKDPVQRSALERDDSYRKMLVRQKAEDIAVNELIVPPHWTGTIDCPKCGVMPWHAACVGEKVEVCPWCSSEGMQRYLEEVKELEKVQAIGTGYGRAVFFKLKMEEERK